MTIALNTLVIRSDTAVIKCSSPFLGPFLGSILVPVLRPVIDPILLPIIGPSLGLVLGLGCSFLFVPFSFLDPKRKEKTGFSFRLEEFLFIPGKRTSSDLDEKELKSGKLKKKKGIP